MDIRRGTATVLVAALMAGGAAADHPGALWSVERLEVRADGATAEQVGKARLSLMKANETYFYGGRAVRMVARVSADGAVRVDVTDARSGAVLVRAARLDDFGNTALAWMDGLECTAGRCGNAAQTQLAAVADQVVETTAKTMRPPAPAKTAGAPKVAWPKRVTGVLPRAAVTNVPVPAARPGTTTALTKTPDLQGLRRVSLARDPMPVPDTSVPPIRISRFVTRGLGPISYGADDALILGEPRALAPATQAVPQPQEAASRTLIGRWVDQVAALFGVADAPAPKPKAIAALRAPEPAASSIAPQGTALTPTERWTANTSPSSGELRLAALDRSQAGAPTRLATPRTAVTALNLPAATAPAISPATAPSPETRLVVRAPGTSSRSTLPLPAAATGIRVLPSPGLGLPSREAQATESVQVTPIRLTPARASRKPDTKLAVKLHPEVFGRYSTSAAERLFGSYGRPDAPLRLVNEDGRGGRSVDGILARRGLALDSDRYAKAERIFWSGRSGSRGFWISLPQVLPSDFVLVASNKASVIANVYPRGASVQVSDAVAKALGLAPGQWSDVQIIALKRLDRTAGRRDGSVTR